MDSNRGIDASTVDLLALNIKASDRGAHTLQTSIRHAFSTAEVCPIWSDASSSYTSSAKLPRLLAGCTSVVLAESSCLHP